MLSSGMLLLRVFWRQVVSLGVSGENLCVMYRVIQLIDLTRKSIILSME